jgi:hypothetical protein
MFQREKRLSDTGMYRELLSNAVAYIVDRRISRRIKVLFVDPSSRYNLWSITSPFPNKKQVEDPASKEL